MFQLVNLAKNKLSQPSTLNLLTGIQQYFLQQQFDIATRAFSAGHGHGVHIEGRMKVTDKIIWINIIPQDGVPRRIAGYHDESLLDAINRHQIPGIFPECQGGDTELRPHHVPIDYYSSGVGCGQCQVVIADPHFDKCNKVPSFEEIRLMKSPTNLATNSRLACCVRLTAELNEMICMVGHNRPQSGEFFTGCDPEAF